MNCMTVSKEGRALTEDAEQQIEEKRAMEGDFPAKLLETWKWMNELNKSCDVTFPTSLKHQ